MTAHPNFHFENRLLRGLPEADLQLLLPKLKWIELKLRDTLYKPNEQIDYAYFPTSGICSVIAETATGVKSEVGIIGREGFVGAAIVLYADSAPFDVIVQVEGRALMIEKGELQETMIRSRALMAALLRFIHVFSVQTTQTAVANALYSPVERLARWLLMCQDRVDTPDFTMTHKFLAVMLGVPGTGVTAALTELESTNIIAATKGRLAVLDRPALETIVRGAYGIPEKEYERLIDAPLS
jgi:CRP-like cAMP-binding protein